MLGNIFSQKKTDVKVTDPNLSVSPTVQTQAPVADSSLNPMMRQDMSVMTHLDARLNAVIRLAEQETRRIKQQFIEPVQLFLGLLSDNDIFQVFTNIPVDVAKLSRELQSKQKEGVFLSQPTLSERSKQILEKAYSFAKTNESDFVTPEDLLSVFISSSEVSAFLESQGVQKSKIEEKLSKSSNSSSNKKSVLNKFGIDLTQKAQDGQLDPVVGRDKEIERVVHIMLRRTKNNPILIGEAGTGKTAIVEGLVQLIVKGTAPKDLLKKRIMQIDVSSLVAGASHRGEFEERLRSVIQEAQNSNGLIVLFIDEIHTLMGTGDSNGALDAANIIKPFLARGQLQIIGTTTTAEYRKYFEKDKAFERRFQPVLVEEPSEETAEAMLEILKSKYEKFHTVVLGPEAIKASVRLSKKYIGQRFLPDKAVDLLDEAAAGVHLENSQGKRSDTTVKQEDIEKVISSWTGIPITKLTEDEGQKLLHLEDIIHKRLIGQDIAVKSVSQAVRRGRIGLANANRPIASFIFLGPTGTGKTELAKTLASILFGKDDAMIRLDMSEYMEKHEVAKLIGAPPGYVGYEEGGQLTEAVRMKPYSVVLLDEIEKAHPDVFNILLQLLEDGRLTDNKGNTISFKNTIIIATSNIGSALIQAQLQSQDGVPQDISLGKIKELSKMLLVELRKFFKPELLNRFDELVLFEPLQQKDMLVIANLQIAGTRKLLLEQNIDITLSQNALTKLAEEGYDPAYGARPLRRLVQTAIENPIAVYIIQKAIGPGDKVVVDYDSSKEQFTFGKANASAQTAPPLQATQNPPVPTDNEQTKTNVPLEQPIAENTQDVPSPAENVPSAPPQIKPVESTSSGLGFQTQ